MRDLVAALSRNEWNAPVEPADLESELYLFLFRKPTLLNAKQSTLFGTLYRHAADLCFRQRKQAGAVLIGRDALGAILREWNSMPNYVWEVVHGPTFSKAAGGRYLELLTQVYRDGCNPFLMSKPDQRTILRALDRLIEVLADVMCGRPESFDVAKHDQAATELPYAALDDDETFMGHQGTYACAEGHEITARLAVRPPQRLGMERVYGHRHCACGEELALAAV
ncbi:hypothetical protein ACQPZK_07525 [Micromonospora sp. CA-249363]|uniref:hypothetical protein n=1 Tax=Micromonospora sp. CA-249363 TaxID=3239963 RepID=UPI003D90F208